MTDEIQKANEIAAQIATTEMLRLLLANILVGKDDAATKANLAKFEELAVDSINSRQHLPQADETTENYIKEAAAGYVSRIIGSINVS